MFRLRIMCKGKSSKKKNKKKKKCVKPVPVKRGRSITAASIGVDIADLFFQSLGDKYYEKPDKRKMRQTGLYLKYGPYWNYEVYNG